MNQATRLTDAEAERLLVIDKKQRDTQILRSSAASDQLVLAAELKPWRFRSKWQRIVYEGPTARKDMENAERSRWVASLGDLLRHTDTPMGRLLRENPSNLQLLGSGLRAGTLRSRVRSIRKFLEWLSVAHKIAFPVHWQQLVEFLQVRVSEPCVRGSLKSAHRSFLFLQESAGISDKFTDSALYDVTRKELFAAALPGRAPRQGPRFPSILLGAFEDNVMDSRHVSPPSSPVLSSRRVYTYVDVMYTGCVRPVSSVSAFSGSSSSVGLRDLSWESALRALPPPLLAALGAELLDDPGVLCEHPGADTLNKVEKLGGDALPG